MHVIRLERQQSSGGRVKFLLNELDEEIRYEEK